MLAASKSQVLVRLISLTILTAWFAALIPLHAESPESASRHRLEGAWWVTVTQYDCTSGVKRPSFSSILLFSRGGTVTEATSNPGFLPGQRSTGFGIWSESEHGTYSASDVAFILFTGGPFQLGSQKLTHTITLDRDADSFTDEAKVQFYNASGTLLMAGCASATATRLQ
ncbi:MAG TPA: hypothetical protein VK574_00110 [Terracidiphilus sp.]|nr:hypothetical protein [Terracidiphilus sp.]